MVSFRTRLSEKTPPPLPQHTHTQWPRNIVVRTPRNGRPFLDNCSAIKNDNNTHLQYQAVVDRRRSVTQQWESKKNPDLSTRLLAQGRRLRATREQFICLDVDQETAQFITMQPRFVTNGSATPLAYLPNLYTYHTTIIPHIDVWLTDWSNIPRTSTTQFNVCVPRPMYRITSLRQCCDDNINQIQLLLYGMHARTHACTHARTNTQFTRACENKISYSKRIPTKTTAPRK